MYEHYSNKLERISAASIGCTQFSAEVAPIMAASMIYTAIMNQKKPTKPKNVAKTGNYPDIEFGDQVRQTFMHKMPKISNSKVQMAYNQFKKAA